MSASDQQILDAVNDAILSIVTGKNESVGIGGRNLQRLGIDKLQAMKREYEVRIARSYTRTGGIFAAVRMRPSE